MKIFLVGLSGSGKTTLGKQLAEVLKMPYVDMDWEIEKRENTTVKEIFSRRGEDYFRQVEAVVLREWAGSKGDFVMGTGGGAPCFYSGMDIINQSGVSIFLDVAVGDLHARLQHATDRPLLSNANEAERANMLLKLSNTRGPVYRQAQIIIEKPTLEKLVSAITLKKESES